jgi:hypothetical protein
LLEAPQIYTQARKVYFMRIMKTWRKWLLTSGYVALVVVIALHFAMWARAEELHGFWGHTNEAARWFQAIDVVSFVAITFCLFGMGWRRWVGLALGLASLVLCCMYAAGL